MPIRALLKCLVPLSGVFVFFAPQIAQAMACENLHTLKLNQTTITESIRVPAGTFKDPSGPWPAEDVPERCQVKGVIRPTSDSEINFEIWMPTASWNHKLQGSGNGGFAGALNYQSGIVQSLQRGYAGVTTDTGHVAKGEDASWAIGHPEKIVDFAHRAIHLMTVNAKAVIKAYYGDAPKHSYFASCSNGGRQALMLAQRYPADYDGIIAGAPANDWTGLMLDFVWNQQAVMKPGAFIPPDHVPALQAEVNRQCNARDGVIGAPQSCSFKPEALLCQGAESSTCLTRPQIESLQAIYQGMRAAHGEITFSGFTPGAEVGSWSGWILGAKPGESAEARFGSGFVGAMVQQDANWKIGQFDFDRDAPRIIQQFGPMMNATDADLSKFASRGGKLILFHGWADAAVPPLNTIRYFEDVGAKMGTQRRSQFVRLFMAPGMQHCFGGPGPSLFGEHTAARQPADPDSDLAAALERWVEGGAAPETVRAIKPKDLLAGAFGSPKGGVERTGLLCAYPKRAKWNGTASADDAANSTCVDEPAPTNLRSFIPATISPEARAIYERLLPIAAAHRAEAKIPHTLAEFDALHDSDIARTEAGALAALKSLNIAVRETQLGGVNVMESTPPQYRDDHTVLLHVHGGGFVLGSAKSSLGGDALMVLATGKRIISIDYTVAPRGNWRIVTDQVVAVYKAVLAQGYSAKSIGMFGDSAGGTIIPASVLKLRDQGLPMPGALVLLSPCVDLNLNGDTETTLREADPALDFALNKAFLAAYAGPEDVTNPYASPIYGDFKKGFPPVLIQAGTKELVLSDAVRLYQALKTAGSVAELDVYEGMTHVFQAYMTGTPEQRAAYAESKRWWSSNLKPGARSLRTSG